jgi:hypothetical protein
VKKCFVLMPFEESLKEIYTEIYVPVCAKRDIKCSRVDEIVRPGSITKDIIEGIMDSDIVIADLSGRNPNVFYELGIAHASGNKTIMTSQSMEDVPFDIANYRIVLYKRSLMGAKKLAADLGNAIDELLTALDRTNNPYQEVVSARGSVRVKQREPIAKHLNFDQLPQKIAAFFHENKVHYKEDLTPELFDRMAKTPKIGSVSLGRLCSALMRDDFFSNLEFLNDFVTKYQLDATRLY